MSLFRMPIVPRFNIIPAMKCIAAVGLTAIVVAAIAGVVVGWLTAAMLQFMALVLMGGA